MAIIKLISVFGILLLTMGSARADWILDMENSQLSYASIKKGSIGENNHFQSMEGRITDKGEITLLIDLASVETWVDIRNARMKEFFFQIKEFPVATLSGQIDMNKLDGLKVGGQRSFDVAFDFDLHGMGQTIEAELVILRLTENTVVVIPGEFIFLDVEKFNLLSGLEKLKKLAKLPSISRSIPITFHLTFNQVP
ncbi:MAG: hypothetical protein COB49_02410 [Alphaproteobacteria bacterium]|nr:MAG: hypothetical protein COB49_02410 [Alphaproteobacteria bacterium]